MRDVNCTTPARRLFGGLIPSACPKGGEAMPLADPFSQSDAFGREAPG